MKIIILYFIFFGVAIVNSDTYELSQDNGLSSIDIQKSLISSYNGIDKLKCFIICSRRKDCVQGVFTFDSTCHLLNFTTPSANYLYSANTLLFNKQFEIMLSAVRLGNNITLSWDINMIRTFSRYIIKYTTDNWITTLTAPGNSFVHPLFDSMID